MSVGLTAVSTTSLERLRDGLVNGHIHAPLTRTDLIAFGTKAQLDALIDTLGGHSLPSCLSLLDAVLAERRRFAHPAPELVWTGPEGMQATARDTAVVLRALFQDARTRVVLAGYSFYQANDVLAPLYKTMVAHGVQSYLFIDIRQAATAQINPEDYGQTAMNEFIQQSWPFGSPYPELYCDRRALHPGPPWCSLHAKCVAIDTKRAFVSSANFTRRGQEHNMETGVLLHDPLFTAQLERQWLGLVGSNLLLRWQPSAQ